MDIAGYLPREDVLRVRSQISPSVRSSLTSSKATGHSTLVLIQRGEMNDGSVLVMLSTDLAWLYQRFSTVCPCPTFASKHPNSRCRYVDRDEAFANGLAAVTDKNEVIMKGDNTTWLPMGVNRSR